MKQTINFSWIAGLVLAAWLLAGCNFETRNLTEVKLTPIDSLDLPLTHTLVAVARRDIEPLPPIKSSRMHSVFEDSTRTVYIVGVGDMMLGTNYPSESYLPPNDGRDLLADVKEILMSADVTFGNLEGTMFDGEGTPKRCTKPEYCYIFRSPERYTQHFVDAGFDVLSIANNHSGDFGWEGRQRTKAALKKAGLEYAGLSKTDETAIFERNGVIYGFCAFAPNSGTCDIRNISNAKRIVSYLKDTADIVIVSFHGGAEGPEHQHVTRETEEFIGENRGNVYAFAHAVIDAGADVVFGHGPHVTRAVELYNDRFIAYSMGNFCTYGRFNVLGPAGIAPIIRLKLDGEGRFQEGKIYPIYQQRLQGPKLDRQNRAVNTIIELTAADFPETPLLISPNGNMTRKYGEVE